MSSTIIQSFGGNVGIGTDIVGDNILNVNKTLSNVGALTVSTLTVAGVNNSNVPEGLIIMWHDKNNIPTGWLLCDGNNGTPNLVNYFPRGSGTNGDVGAVQNTSTLSLGANGNAGTAGINNALPVHNHAVAPVASGQHRHSTNSQGDHTHGTNTNTPHQHSCSNHSHQHGSQNNTHDHNTNNTSHTHDQTINDTRYAAFSGGNPVDSTWASWTAHKDIVSNADDNRNTNAANAHYHTTSSNHRHNHNVSQYNTNHTHNLGSSGGHQHQCQNALNTSGNQQGKGNDHQHQCNNSANGHDHQVYIQLNSGGNTFSSIPRHRHLCFIMKGPAS
jgi:hypothetical protein